MKKLPWLTLTILIILAPNTAEAHAIVLGGFPEGFWHPVLGFDHLLAMVSVGIISAQMGGRAIWSVPATFVASMVLGGLTGMNYTLEIWETIDATFLIEFGIGLSVFLLAAAIALNKKIPALPVFGFVAIFGSCHGIAHGIEIPDLASSEAYVSGFVLGTSCLHLIGVAIGHYSEKIPMGRTALRYAGAVAAGVGLHIMVQLLS